MTMEELSNVQGRAWEDVDVSRTDLHYSRSSTLTSSNTALINEDAGFIQGFGSEVKLGYWHESSSALGISLHLHHNHPFVNLARTATDMRTDSISFHI